MDLMLTLRYLDDLAALGVKIPEDAIKARAVHKAALAAASSQPADDLRAAIVARDLTPENAAARVLSAAAALTARQNALQLVAGLQPHLNRMVRDAIRGHFAEIHRDLAAAFKPAADGVAKAAEIFGPETAAEEVLTMPPAAVAAWKALTGHVATLDRVCATDRHLLADITRSKPASSAALYIADGARLAEAEDLYRVYGSWQPWPPRASNSR